MPLPTPKPDLDAILRVNQAGEYGAKRIYEGQLATIRDPKAKQQIQQMLAQEREHLEYFTAELGKRGTRPTLLQPLWHFGGFALGAVTALMGKQAAMACTVAVESVIDGHYREQLDALRGGQAPPSFQESPPAARLALLGEEANADDCAELCKKIEKFRAEEVEHHDLGLAEGAEQAVAYPLLSAAIQTITRTAIALSKRI